MINDILTSAFVSPVWQVQTARPQLPMPSARSMPTRFTRAHVVPVLSRTSAFSTGSPLCLRSGLRASGLEGIGGRGRAKGPLPRAGPLLIGDAIATPHEAFDLAFPLWAKLAGLVAANILGVQVRGSSSWNAKETVLQLNGDDRSPPVPPLIRPSSQSSVAPPTAVSPSQWSSCRFVNSLLPVNEL